MMVGMPSTRSDDRTRADGPARGGAADRPDRAGRPAWAGWGAGRWPLVPTALVGGVLAASATLLVAVLVGLLGWFLTDAGAHGTSVDAVRAALLGWLAGHGSGLVVPATGGTVVVTAVPLGVTALAAWSCWRTGQRVGESVADHGPDADALADGHRDTTVPVAVGAFVAGYLLAALLVLLLGTSPSAGTGATASVPRLLVHLVPLIAVAGGLGLAAGSGRAAGWLDRLPARWTATLDVALAVLRSTLLGLVLLVGVAVATGLGDIASLASRLHLGASDLVLVALLCLLVAPNAVAWAGAYALGPGFAVGTGTVVSTTAVTLGPLPVLPPLGALPDGPLPSWAAVLVRLLPFVLAAGAAYRHLRWSTEVDPDLRWDEGLLRGVVGGALAGLLLAVLCALAGGAVGPGRMAETGPELGPVLVLAVATLGLAGGCGGLLGAVLGRRWSVRA